MVLVGVSHLHDSAHHVDLLVMVDELGLGFGRHVGHRGAGLHGELPGHEAHVVHPVLHGNAVLARALLVGEAGGLPDASSSHASFVLKVTSLGLTSVSGNNESGLTKLVCLVQLSIRKLIGLALTLLLSGAPVLSGLLLGNDPIDFHVGLLELADVGGGLITLGGVDIKAPLGLLFLDVDHIECAILTGTFCRLLVGDILKAHRLGSSLSLFATLLGSFSFLDGSCLAVLLLKLEVLGSNAGGLGIAIGFVNLGRESCGLGGLVDLCVLPCSCGYTEFFLGELEEGVLGGLFRFLGFTGLNGSLLRILEVGLLSGPGVPGGFGGAFAVRSSFVGLAFGIIEFSSLIGKC